MTTRLGDFLISVSEGPDGELPDRAVTPTCWPNWDGMRANPRKISPAPGISIAFSGDVTCLTIGESGRLGIEHEPEMGGKAVATDSSKEIALQSWISDKRWQPEPHRGRYFYLFWDARTRTVSAFTDGFRTYPIYYMVTPQRLLCASDLRLILAVVDQPPPVDKTAIYHYLNFAYIPSPHTVMMGIKKLEPGFRLDGKAGAASTKKVFDTSYPEDLVGDVRHRAADLRNRIVQNVSDYLPGPTSNWGTFLSGGTDSSSIAGILARASGDNPVDSFSIGFSEGGYDEMSYSQIASRHFGLTAHELNVGEAETVALIPRLAQGFDEPFGNSSAIPTFYCADLARKNGKSLLIAGDGGDEIFGGNERYAKDRIFEWYHNAPTAVRQAGKLLTSCLSSIDTHATNRIRNMIRRGELPNPDRFYSDDSFASDHFEELLSVDFRQSVNSSDSLQIQRDIFACADAKGELHKLMYLDLKMTIAESDVVKVVRSAKLAGVDVAFPYLDRTLVDYTGRLAERFKVNRLKKRYLFKIAMADILPTEILKKKKQGFGLPISVWLRKDGALRTMVNDVVLSEQTFARGYFNPIFLRQLIERHERGVWDHSSEIFRILMLELWHREHLDKHV